LQIALDATYSIGRELTGVGSYSNEIISGLSTAHPDVRFRLCYRPHRFMRALRQGCPPNCRRRLLFEQAASGSVDLFHGLNQRLPAARYRRSVCTFHDLFVITSEYSSSDFRRRFTEQAREAAARADLIIAVSEFTASQLSEHLSVDPARIRVVRHGVHAPPRPPALDKEPVILHVGAIQRRKNIQRLVEAFEACPTGWRLVLAGSVGYGGSQIIDRIEASPRRDDIEIVGYLPSHQLALLYARAGILAFPSLGEGFGLPLLEAMANGVAVLTSNGSALREVAGDAAFLVDPLDAESIRAGITLLIESDSLRKDYARRGLTRSKQFSWERAVAETWNVYQELLG